MDNLLPPAGPMVYGAPLMGGCLPPGDGVPQLANDEPPPISNTTSLLAPCRPSFLLAAIHQLPHHHMAALFPANQWQCSASLLQQKEDNMDSSTLLPKNFQMLVPNLGINIRHRLF
jgi:hypothetical protein